MAPLASTAEAESSTLRASEVHMAIKVLGANVSPFVRKTRAFLAEKGIPYEIEQINPASPPDGWRANSPLGKIPASSTTGRSSTTRR